jgi:hypothetical protein
MQTENSNRPFLNEYENAQFKSIQMWKQGALKNGDQYCK